MKREREREREKKKKNKKHVQIGWSKRPGRGLAFRRICSPIKDRDICSGTYHKDILGHQRLLEGIHSRRHIKEHSVLIRQRSAAGEGICVILSACGTSAVGQKCNTVCLNNLSQKPTGRPTVLSLPTRAEESSRGFPISMISTNAKCRVVNNLRKL